MAISERIARALLAALLVSQGLTFALAHPSNNGSAAAANGVRFPTSEQLSSAIKQGKESQVKDSETSGASARFGFLNTNSLYPQGGYATGTGQYGASASPLKLDLGGLLVGGAIGLGLIFLVPKLFNPYGGSGSGCYNARSVEDSDSGASQFLARLDKTLAEHNIDTASCAQRALCSYVQSSTIKVLNGSASTFDKVLGDISSKASAENIFGSSEYQRALDVGRSGSDCAASFPLCPSDSSKVLGAVKSIVMSSLF